MDSNFLKAISSILHTLLKDEETVPIRAARSRRGGSPLARSCFTAPCPEERIGSPDVAIASTSSLKRKARHNLGHNDIGDSALEKAGRVYKRVRVLGGYRTPPIGRTTEAAFFLPSSDDEDIHMDEVPKLVIRPIIRTHRTEPWIWQEACSLRIDRLINSLGSPFAIRVAVEHDADRYFAKKARVPGDKEQENESSHPTNEILVDDDEDQESDTDGSDDHDSYNSSDAEDSDTLGTGDFPATAQINPVVAPVIAGYDFDWFENAMDQSFMQEPGSDSSDEDSEDSEPFVLPTEDVRSSGPTQEASNASASEIIGLSRLSRLPAFGLTDHDPQMKMLGTPPHRHQEVFSI